MRRPAMLLIKRMNPYCSEFLLNFYKPFINAFNRAPPAVSVGCITLCQFQLNKSSRPEVIREKGFLKNFSKFIGKYMCQRFF